MMKSDLDNDRGNDHRQTEEESWRTLNERIRCLANRKTAAMIDATDLGEEPEGFDASARTLRLLMSAAEIADRMQARETAAKEANDHHDVSPENIPFTDADTRAAYARISRIVAEADADPASDGASVGDSVAGTGAGGKGLGASGAPPSAGAKS